jgi:hypothetical protein
MMGANQTLALHGTFCVAFPVVSHSQQFLPSPVLPVLQMLVIWSSRIKANSSSGGCSTTTANMLCHIVCSCVLTNTNWLLFRHCVDKKLAGQ